MLTPKHLLAITVLCLVIATGEIKFLARLDQPAQMAPVTVSVMLEPAAVAHKHLCVPSKQHRCVGEYE